MTDAPWRIKEEPHRCRPRPSPTAFRVCIIESTADRWTVARVYGPTAEECRARALSFIANNGPVTS